jgi:hypothetical protein
MEQDIIAEDPLSGLEALAILLDVASPLEAIFVSFGLFSVGLVSILITIRMLRNFIEATPRGDSKYDVLRLISDLVGGVTRGVLGLNFQEQINKSQKLEKKVSSLSNEVEQLTKRNSVSMLPLGVDEVTDWQAPLVVSRNRLLGEIERLRARSTAYLVFGVFLSLAAVALFFFIIFYLDEVSPDASALSYMKDFLPKFTLAVMVQIIASFFLKMHVSSEAEIKWTSNEVTNLEHRFTAMALSKAGMSEVLINELSKTERNFIIGKDQKTLSAHETVTVESLIDVLKDVVAKKPA